MKRIFPFWTVLMFIALLCIPAKGIADAKYVIKLAHDHKLSSPHHGAATMIKERLEKDSNGEIEVTVYPNQVLGTGIQMVEMLQAGAIQMLAVATSQVQPIHPPLQVLSLPFLFQDKEDLYRHFEGAFGQALFEPLLMKNITGLAFWESGFKQFTCNYPIRWPEDFKGRKIRIMPSPVIREQFKALGASPVPIDFSELYNALQQGVVDGQENPLVGIVPLKLYEVQKYITMSNHAWLGYALMANSRFLESLPEKYRRLIRITAEESATYEIELVNRENSKYLETIKKSNMSIIELTPEQSAAFRNAVQPVYNWFSKNVQGGDRYIKMLK